MCLEINKEATTEHLKQYGRVGIVKAWKVLSPRYDSMGELVGLQAPFYTKHYVEGLNVSDRRTVQLSRDENRSGSVYYGIHVFTSVTEAVRYASDNTEIVVTVYCDNKDFVALGNVRQAVYKKITIKDEDYRNAFVELKRKIQPYRY